MQPRVLSREWKAGNFITRLSGLTLPHSTLENGVASWIASLAATRASQTASPEKAADPTMTGSSPTKLFASCRSAGLIVSYARTSQGMQTDSSQFSSPHWKGWATALRQEFSARPKWGQAIAGSDCSSWPTSCVTDANGARNLTSGRSDPESRHHAGVTLNDAIALWTAASASDAAPGGANSKRKQRGAGGADLQEMAEHWPTPASRDHKGANSEAHVTTNGTGRRHMDQLPNYVEHGFPSLPQVQQIQDGKSSSAQSRRLNPRFVEWLMGWPIGWTDFAAPEMEFSHWLRRGRGMLSTLVTEPPQDEIQGGLFDGH